MALRLLLVVERAWVFRRPNGVYIHLSPEFAMGALPVLPPTALLKRPDGTERRVDLYVGQEHLNYMYAYRFDEEGKRRDPWREFCYLKDIEPEEVPVGTEVWVDG